MNALISDHPILFLQDTALADAPSHVDLTTCAHLGESSNLDDFFMAVALLDSPSFPIDLEQETLAELVQELHRMSGLTWQQLAHLFGVSRRALHAWAAGGRMNAFHAERLSELARLINDLPGEKPEQKRAALFAPGHDGRSAFERERGKLYAAREEITGNPFRPGYLLDGIRD